MAKRKSPTPHDPTRAAAYVAAQQANLADAQTALNKVKFLDAFAGVGNVSAAAKLAGVGRRSHYDWVRGDAAYATAFGEAVDEAADRLETEARRRAVTGTSESVYYKGATCGTLRKYSDTLLIFLLKGARPEKYSERFVHTGSGKRGAILLEDIVAGPVLDTAGSA